MLVVCEDIDQAKEVEDLLASTEFFGGRYREAVLRIDSEVPDASLAALADVEEPECPVRIIVSVGMLREGWDVNNVTVVAGLRPYSAKANILPELCRYQAHVADYVNVFLIAAALPAKH